MQFTLLVRWRSLPVVHVPLFAPVHSPPHSHLPIHTSLFTQLSIHTSYSQAVRNYTPAVVKPMPYNAPLFISELSARQRRTACAAAAFMGINAAKFIDPKPAKGKVVRVYSSVAV